MSLRHMPRQPEPDATLHEPANSTVHPHTHNLVTQRNRHTNPTIPTTPSGMSNGSSHANAIVSPTAAATVVTNGVVPAPSSMIHKLNVANEQTWLLIGSLLLFPIDFPVVANPERLPFPGRVAEQMGDLEHALSAYENALRHNPMSLSGLTQVAGIARIKENYPKVNVYLRSLLTLQPNLGRFIPKPPRTRMVCQEDWSCLCQYLRF